MRTWNIEQHQTELKPFCEANMRIPLTALLLAIFTLTAGCAIQQLEKGMDSLLGQPVNRLIEKIGFPSEEKVVAKRKIYVWQISSTHLSTNTQTSAYSGMVGTKPVYGTATTYGGTTAMPVSCKLTVEVDSDDKIIYWIGEGSEFGCATYARRFE
jgi:hypothetical protein